MNQKSSANGHKKLNQAQAMSLSYLNNCKSLNLRKNLKASQQTLLRE